MHKSKTFWEPPIHIGSVVVIMLIFWVGFMTGMSNNLVATAVFDASNPPSNVQPENVGDQLAPKNLIATGGVRSITLAWEDSAIPPPLGSRYNIYRSQASGGSFTRIASSISARNYTDNINQEGALYFYKVSYHQTSNANNYIVEDLGPFSNEAGATTDNPVPALTNISPTSQLVGSPTFALTVTGSRFVAGSKVLLNGSDRATTVDSSTQLTASIPASDLSSAGAFNITVLNPAPGGGTSGGQTLTINNPLPTTTGISPTSTTAGSRTFALTVNGTGFNSQSVARWGTTNKTPTSISPTSLTALITADEVASAGTFDIRVLNPTPGGGTSEVQNFTVSATPNPAPALTSISPTLKKTGSPTFTLVVNGANFLYSSVVNFAGSPKETTFVNSTQLTALILSEDLRSAGISNITVTNPAPGGGTSSAQAFTVADKYVCADYGACPNDNIDDTVALNTAFAASQTYSTIAFEPGFYLVSGASAGSDMINILKSNITITGTGATLRATNYGFSVVRISANYVTVDGLNIQGQNNVRNLVYLNGTSSANITNFTLRNCDIGGANQSSGAGLAAGVNINPFVHDVTVNNCKIHDIDGNADGTARGVLVNAGWTNSTSTALALTHTVMISNNIIENITNSQRSGNAKWDSDGVYVTAGSNSYSPNMNVTIDHNTFKHVEKRGVKFQGSNVAVTNNTIEHYSIDSARNMYSGISIYGNNAIVTGNTINLGSVRGYVSYGIEMGAGLGVVSSATISGNYINGLNVSPGNWFGFYSPGPILNVALDSNTITGFQDGIRIYCTVATTTSSPNTHYCDNRNPPSTSLVEPPVGNRYNATYPAPHDSARNVTISNNRISGSSAVGITMSGGFGINRYFDIAANRNTINNVPYFFDATTDGANLTICGNTGTWTARNADGTLDADGMTTGASTRLTQTTNC